MGVVIRRYTGCLVVTFLVVTYCYVLQETHAFLEMLPFWLIINVQICSSDILDSFSQVSDFSPRTKLFLI